MIPRSQHAIGFVPFLLLLSSLAGCSVIQAGQQSTRAPAGRVITAAQIERSGATDAWDVLKRSSTSLSLSERGNGEPSRIARRGQSSIILRDVPRVIVDGTEMSDFRHLRQIPANSIATMRILTGIQGTTYYGTNSGSGVIVIHTKHGPDL